MSRLTAGGKLERLLSIVPWVAANDGPLVADVADRFDYPEDRLVTDLTEVVFMVGVYPYTPDQLIDVTVEDDRVWIRYADYFARPLTLTAEQGLILVAASSSVLAVPGAEPDGPLARGLAKLAAALGIEADDSLEVELGSAEPATLDTVRSAVAGNTRLRIEYYAYGRDEITERLVDPFRVTSDSGHWYMLAWCHMAEGERLFRLDRIRSLQLTDETFDPPTDVPEIAVFEPRGDDPRVVLRLAPTASWVAEYYPAEKVVDNDQGGLDVTIAVSAVPWLERLLLRLGPEAEMVQADNTIAPDLGAAAARRILQRYAD